MPILISEPLRMEFYNSDELDINKTHDSDYFDNKHLNAFSPTFNIPSNSHRSKKKNSIHAESVNGSETQGSVYFSMGKNYGIPIDLNKNSGDIKPILIEEKEKPTELRNQSLDVE